MALHIKGMLQQGLVRESEAFHNIRSYILYLKGNGVKKVGVIDLMLHFNYSPKRINRVMEKLEKEGMVKEEEW